jgi:hypothetical protein
MFKLRFFISVSAISKGILRSMPATLEFGRDNRVAITTITDPLDMRDMASIQQEFQQQVIPLEFSVYSILDITQLTKLPANMLSISLGTSKYGWDPKLGMILVVSTSAFITGMLTLVHNISARPIVMFKTTDEAWAELDLRLAAEANPA